MELNFVKINPCQNMTIFITDEIDKSLYSQVSNKLMDYSNLNAEQVGFIKFDNQNQTLFDASLEMMGGEFCANATRSLAALVVHNDKTKDLGNDKKYHIIIKTTGVDEILDCEVEKTSKNNMYISGIDMPINSNTPKQIQIKILDDNIEMFEIELPGITHFIIDSKKLKYKDEIIKKVKQYMSEKNYDAFGIMFYDYIKKYLTPIVYVKNTQSLIYEKSCGSGSSAVAILLTYQAKENIDVVINQPGGALELSTKYKKDKLINIKLKGEVEIIAYGKVYV